jgi:hypothetical protein
MVLTIPSSIANLLSGLSGSKGLFRGASQETIIKKNRNVDINNIFPIEIN